MLLIMQEKRNVWYKERLSCKMNVEPLGRIRHKLPNDD